MRLSGARWRSPFLVGTSRGFERANDATDSARWLLPLSLGTAEVDRRG